ncbi:MAG: hypothetical protein Dbin4_01730 [Alphaproteobacteria bacterium]|nr:hypothetical protein [Alphaproteobacteria bacterium]
MKKFVFILLSSAGLSCGMVAAANAAAVMPDFGDVPIGWVTDRYDPASFANVGIFQGRNDVLGIGIDDADGLTSRSGGFQSTFYNTQGRQHAISGGAGSVLSADLYIPVEWEDSANGHVRSDMWGVMTDGSSVSDYPIIGFTNYGGAPRLRVWDGDIIDGWVDLLTPVAYNNWMAFSIEYTGTSYVYSVNDALVYTDATINGSTGFSATIMQAYNFCGDTSISGAVCVDYTAHWSNTQGVPEPMTMGLLGAGLAGIGLTRRRKA